MSLPFCYGGSHLERSYLTTLTGIVVPTDSWCWNERVPEGSLLLLAVVDDEEVLSGGGLVLGGPGPSHTRALMYN